MLKVYFSGKPGKGFSGSHARPTEGGCPRSPAPQGEWVALLGMDLARRYLFFEDAQMLLAESRKRPALFANSLELARQLEAAKQTPSETGAHYPCP